MCNGQLSSSMQPIVPEVLCQLISDQISEANTLNQANQKELRKLPGGRDCF